MFCQAGVELLDIVAAQPLAAGAEVWNTYGEHGNAELLKKYGFALPFNAFDEVRTYIGTAKDAVVRHGSYKAPRDRRTGHSASAPLSWASSGHCLVPAAATRPVDHGWLKEVASSRTTSIVLPAACLLACSS